MIEVISVHVSANMSVNKHRLLGTSLNAYPHFLCEHWIPAKAMQKCSYPSQMWSPLIENDGHWFGTVDGLWYNRGITQMVLLVELCVTAKRKGRRKAEEKTRKEGEHLD